MKIGISTECENLIAVPKAYSDYQIDHVQISLSADVDAIRNQLVKLVSEFRAESPAMEISIHAYPYNLAEKVDAVRKVWIGLAERTISIANEPLSIFILAMVMTLPKGRSMTN